MNRKPATLSLDGVSISVARKLLESLESIYGGEATFIHGGTFYVNEPPKESMDTPSYVANLQYS